MLPPALFPRGWLPSLCVFLLLALPAAAQPKAVADPDDLPKGAVARLGTTRLRLAKYVFLAPDGKTAVGWWDDTIRLWDVPSGKQLKQFRCDGFGPINDVALSPDGRWLACSLYQNNGNKARFNLWDLQAGGLPVVWEFKTFSGTRGGTWIRVHFSADSRTLSAATFATVHHWDPTTLQEKGRFAFDGKGGKHEAQLSAFSADGKVLATTDQGTAVVRLWDTTSGQLLHELPGHGGQYNIFVTALVFSHDGKVLATADAFEKIRLWDVAGGRLLHTLTGPGDAVHSLALAPDAETVVAGACVWNWDVARPIQALHVWNLEAKKAEPEILAVPYADSVNFSADGKLFAYTTATRSTVIMDWKQRKPLHSFPGHTGEVAALAFAPDGKILASGGWDHAVCLWDAATGKPLRTLREAQGPVRCLAFAPQGDLLAGGGWEHVRLWDARTGKEVQKLGDQSKWAYSFAFAPGEDQFAVGVSFTEPALWQPKKGLWSPVNDPPVVTVDAVQHCAYSPDGRWLACGGSHGRLWLRDRKTGKTVHTLIHTADPAQHQWLMGLHFTPDSTTLVAVYRGPIVLWDVATGKQGPTLSCYNHGPVAISPDGRYLATGAAAGAQHEKPIFEIWDLQTRKTVNLEVRPPEPVTSLAFSPNGKLLATGHRDTTILLWEFAKMLSK
jgi:WD40 repeat protein